MVRDGRSREILYGIQEAVRVRFKGYHSMYDIRDEVHKEIVRDSEKIRGLARVSSCPVYAVCIESLVEAVRSAEQVPAWLPPW